MCVSRDISRRRAFEAYRQKTHRRPPERPREGCTAARPSPVPPGWPTAGCCWSTHVASPWATGSPSPQLTGSQAAKGAPSCMAWAILDFYFNTISLLKNKKSTYKNPVFIGLCLNCFWHAVTYPETRKHRLFPLTNMTTRNIILSTWRRMHLNMHWH